VSFFGAGGARHGLAVLCQEQRVDNNPDTTKRNTKIRKVQGPWMQPRSLYFLEPICPYFIAKSQTLLKGFSRAQ
jgi:hypothetical protein